MNIYTTIFKVQALEGGMAVLHFNTEAKDRYTAENRNIEKLHRQSEDELQIISSLTKQEVQPHSDRLAYRQSLKRDKRTKY